MVSWAWEVVSNQTDLYYRPHGSWQLEPARYALTRCHRSYQLSTKSTFNSHKLIVLGAKALTLGVNHGSLWHETHLPLSGVNSGHIWYCTIQRFVPADHLAPSTTTSHFPRHFPRRSPVLGGVELFLTAARLELILRVLIRESTRASVTNKTASLDKTAASGTAIAR